MRSVEEIYKDVQHHMWNLMMYHSQNFQYCKYY